MKELSIEEKAKAYDEALEITKEWYNDPQIVVGFKANLEKLFPVLKESEDERIRKDIKQHFLYLDDSFPDKAKWLNWLAKQGGQKHVEAHKFKVGKWYQCTKDFFGKGVTFDKNTAYYCAKEGCLQCKYGCHIAIVEELYDNFKLWTIQDAKDGDVLAAHECYVIFKEIDGLNIRCHCTYHYLGFNPSFCVDTLQNKTAFYPATKEQRDLLFQKIKEEGFEWDAEKKELKKIEQKPVIVPKFRVGDVITDGKDFPRCTIEEIDEQVYCCDYTNIDIVDADKNWKLVEQKSSTMSIDEAIEHCKEKSCGNNACALEHKQLEKWLTELKELKEQKPVEWSEEDVDVMDTLIKYLTQECDKTPIPEDKEMFDREILMLKSLKDRYTWKPSEEQMKILSLYAHVHDVLALLYQDLKKLKG